MTSWELAICWRDRVGLTPPPQTFTPLYPVPDHGLERIRPLPEPKPKRVYHTLTNIDNEARTATCAKCGPVTIASRGKKDGQRLWRCRTVERNRTSRRWRKREEHRRHAKPICEQCGFRAEDICQIDVHHKDGNHKNNDPSNLRSLCANCHRLEHRGHTGRVTDVLPLWSTAA